MIDIDAPGADNIFKASGYTSAIKIACQQYIFLDFEERQHVFSNIRNECYALSEFSGNAFPEDYEQISEELMLIVAETDRLAAIDNKTEAGNCTVCNTKLIKFSTRSSYPPYFITYCPDCPENIHSALIRVDELTGAAWI